MLTKVPMLEQELGNICGIEQGVWAYVGRLEDIHGTTKKWQHALVNGHLLPADIIHWRSGGKIRVASQAKMDCFEKSFKGNIVC